MFSAQYRLRFGACRDPLVTPCWWYRDLTTHTLVWLLFLASFCKFLSNRVLPSLNLSGWCFASYDFFCRSCALSMFCFAWAFTWSQMFIMTRSFSLKSFWLSLKNFIRALDSVVLSSRPLDHGWYVEVILWSVPRNLRSPSLSLLTNSRPWSDITISATPYLVIRSYRKSATPRGMINKLSIRASQV